MIGMVREITKSYYLLLSLPIFIAVFAVLTTVKELTMVIVFSALMVFLALYTNTEPTITISLDVPKRRVFVGDVVEVVVRVTVNGGLGLIMLAAPPASYVDNKAYRESFKVVDGKAAHVVFKGFKKIEREFRFKVKALKRGVYEFGDVVYTYHHIFGLMIIENKVDNHIKLSVVPKYRFIRRNIGRIKPSTVTPRVTPNRLGPYSTEFMDIREYVLGDPYKFINWKATARSTSGKLFVNEYEREGLRNVVFLLDINPWMRLGYAYENPLEYGIPLILSLTRTLLRYGYNVGLWTLPPSGIYVMPSSGQTQFYRLLMTLLRIEHVGEKPSAGSGNKVDSKSKKSKLNLDPTLYRVIVETKPILMVITNVANRDAVLSIKQTLCVQHGDKCRPLGKALVVDIPHGSIVMRESLRDYLGNDCLGTHGIRARLYKSLPRGTPVVTWDPVCENVGMAVVKLMPRIRWLS